MKKIVQYSDNLWGPSYPEYYPGEPLGHWDDIAEGAGPSPQEAYDAALDHLAVAGWDVAPLEGDYTYDGWEEDVQEVLDESGQEQEHPVYVVTIKVRGE